MGFSLMEHASKKFELEIMNFDYWLDAQIPDNRNEPYFKQYNIFYDAGPSM